MRLQDKTALITGAASGIGFACARRYGAEGAKVLLADVDADVGARAAATLREDGVDAAFRQVDVGERAQVEAAVADAVERWGRLDVAIANAGILRTGDVLDITDADFDDVLRVNLKGVFLTCQVAARQMVAQDGGGCIINMSSTNAVLAIPQILPYAVAKGGVSQITKVMGVALARRGVRVNAIGPGSIATDMFLNNIATDADAYRAIMTRTPMGRAGEPEEIAAIAVFLASEDASYITGQTIYADGGRLPLAYTVPADG